MFEIYPVESYEDLKNDRWIGSIYESSYWIFFQSFMSLTLHERRH